MLFGYTVKDLLNKRVTVFIPEPFKTPHNQYVYNHLTTGKTKIIGMGNRRLPLLQKDGTLASITLSVTKVLGTGSEVK
jgi:two-component system sensor histidine kinase/response regulator